MEVNTSLDLIRVRVARHQEPTVDARTRERALAACHCNTCVTRSCKSHARRSSAPSPILQGPAWWWSRRPRRKRRAPERRGPRRTSTEWRRPMEWGSRAPGVSGWRRGPYPGTGKGWAWVNAPCASSVGAGVDRKAIQARYEAFLGRLREKQTQERLEEQVRRAIGVEKALWWHECCLEGLTTCVGVKVPPRALAMQKRMSRQGSSLLGSSSSSESTAVGAEAAPADLDHADTARCVARKCCVAWQGPWRSVAYSHDRRGRGNWATVQLSPPSPTQEEFAGADGQVGPCEGGGGGRAVCVGGHGPGGCPGGGDEPGAGGEEGAEV